MRPGIIAADADADAGLHKPTFVNKLCVRLMLTLLWRAKVCWNVLLVHTVGITKLKAEKYVSVP